VTDLGAIQAVVDASVDVAFSAVGVVAEDCTYTPAGGTAQPGVSAVFFVDERPGDGLQRRGAHILVPLAAVPDEPRAGATVASATDLWTVRTALAQTELWNCEAWA
jgi:hypothetical protein